MTRSLPTAPLLAALALFAALASPTAASADTNEYGSAPGPDEGETSELGQGDQASQDEHDGTAAWAVLTYEMTTAVSLGLVLGLDGNGAALAVGILAPMGLAVGAGFAAHHYGWSPSPALAVHGALWTAAILFMTTAGIDGTARGDAWHVGPAAFTVGGLGLVLGATFGALGVGADAEPVWLGGPLLAVPAMLFGGVVALFGSLNSWSNERVGRAIVFSTAAGGLGGLALGYAMAGRGDPPEWMSRVQPSLAPTRRGATLGLSGTF